MCVCVCVITWLDLVSFCLFDNLNLIQSALFNMNISYTFIKTLIHANIAAVYEYLKTELNILLRK